MATSLEDDSVELLAREVGKVEARVDEGGAWRRVREVSALAASRLLLRPRLRTSGRHISATSLGSLSACEIDAPKETLAEVDVVDDGRLEPRPVSGDLG